MQQSKAAAEIPRGSTRESMQEMPTMVSDALATHETEVLSESKKPHSSAPSGGQTTIQPSDFAMEAPTEAPTEATDEENGTAAFPGTAAGAAAEQERRPAPLYSMKDPEQSLSAPSVPPLLLTDASGGVRKAEGVAIENEGSDKTPEVTTASAQQAAGKPAHALEPPNLVASGLIMIETVPGKRISADEHIAEESVPEGRRKRKPAPPREATPDEPLVQIETHK